MKKLDLHGIRHEDVRSEVIHFIEDNWAIGEEVEIMTGNSTQMKSIVEEILNEYKLDYRIGDFFGFDRSYITVKLG